MSQSAATTERVQPGERVAFVVMQFASTPWNLFDIAAGPLREQGYLPLRADHIAGHERDQEQAVHLWTMLRRADFILVDITNWNVNVYVELGVAAAWARLAKECGAKTPEIGVIGAGDDLPFDAQHLKVHPYRVKGSEKQVAASIVRAVNRALRNKTQEAIPAALDIHTLEFAPGTRDGLSGKAGKELLDDHLPYAVASVLRDPGAAVLATRYIQYLGSRVGEELAAFGGFPPLPEAWKSLDSAGGSDDDTVPLVLPGRLHTHALGVLRQLLRVVDELDSRVAQSVDVGKFSDTNRRLVFARALQLKAAERSSAEIEVLSTILGRIAAASAKPRAGDPEPPLGWSAGIAAIKRLNRLRAISVAGSALGTIPKIEEVGKGGKPSLDLIATLGGASFLGYHIGILTETSSPYTPPGTEFATATYEGQEVVVVTDHQTLATYQDGLRELARHKTFTFAVEHPFHFRVLLEVLSDENRRYAAECILNYQALKATWNRKSTWDHFTWFRNQLPAVVNLGPPSSPSVTAFEQHYLGFGRTPHTSSFMQMTYAAKTLVPQERWWPGDLHGMRDRFVRNLPNSVAVTRADVARQRVLGALWRGVGDEAALAAAGGEIYSWDGKTGPRHIASLLWNIGRWPSLRFPELVLAELQCGAWILQAMEARHAEADAAQHAGGGGLHDQAPMVAQQTQSVLDILRLYLEEYLDGDDGVHGILTTLDRLASIADGPRMRANVGRLRDGVEALAADLQSHLPQGLPT